MEQTPLLHYVYVDFENTQAINLALIHNKPIRVTLLVGEKQKQLPLTLVQHLLQYHAKVNLIEITTTSKNALDFVLAFHIGQTVALNSQGYFYIVSQDKGYDALIKHLTERKIKAERYTEFSLLPLFNKQPLNPAPHPIPNPLSDSQLTVIPQAKQIIPIPTPTVPEAAKLILEHLRKNTSNRPSRYASLMTYTQSYLRNVSPTVESKAVVEQLIKQNLIRLDDQQKVQYTF